SAGSQNAEGPENGQENGYSGSGPKWVWQAARNSEDSDSVLAPSAYRTNVSKTGPALPCHRRLQSRPAAAAHNQHFRSLLSRRLESSDISSRDGAGRGSAVTSPRGSVHPFHQRSSITASHSRR